MCGRTKGGFRESASAITASASVEVREPLQGSHGWRRQLDSPCEHVVDRGGGPQPHGRRRFRTVMRRPLPLGKHSDVEACIETMALHLRRDPARIGCQCARVDLHVELTRELEERAPTVKLRASLRKVGVRGGAREKHTPLLRRSRAPLRRADQAPTRRRPHRGLG